MNKARDKYLLQWGNYLVVEHRVQSLNVSLRVQNLVPKFIQYANKYTQGWMSIRDNILDIDSDNDSDSIYFFR